MMSNNKWLLLGDSYSEEVLWALERYLGGEVKVKVEVKVVELNSSEDIDFTSCSKVLVYLNSRKIEDFSEPNGIYQKLLEAIFKFNKEEDLPSFIFLSTEKKLTYKGWKDFKGYEWCYLLYEAVGSQYIHLPKQLAELRDLAKEERDLIEQQEKIAGPQNLAKGKEGKRENPLRVFGGCAWEKFKKYDKKYKERKCEGEDRYKNVTDFYLEASKFHLGEEDYRRRLSHDLVNLEGKAKVLEAAAQIERFAWFDLIWALSQKRRFPLLKGKVSILVVDNNLRKDVKKSLEEIEKYFHWEFWQVGQDEREDFFGDLLKKIEEKKEKLRIEVKRINDKENGKKTDEKTIKDFNLILQDLYLNSDTKGDDFLPLYLEHYPRIPVFIYSGSEDSEVINRTLKKGADYYLFKTRTLALPKALLNYYERLGKLITLFEVDKYKYRNNLIGNIRYWNFKKDFLWFGDKCYHMVNHSFNHTRNDWEIANKLLYPILKEKGLKPDNNKDGSMTAEDLYCLSMAIWLHDIGHKGNQRYGEPHLIRDNHGVISGELILSQSHLFNIEDKDDKKDENLDAYKYMTFPLGPAEVPAKKPVTQVIQEKVHERKKLTVLEKIALICIYHKGAPISKDDYRKMLSEGEYVTLDFYKKSDKNEEVITLEDIIKNDKGEHIEGGESLESIVALFRFIDGLDISKSRVGDLNEGDLKKRVIEQDKNYQLEKLKKKVGLLSKAKFENDMQRVFFKKIFYQDIRDKIEKEEPVGSLEVREVAQNLSEELNDYIMLVNYAQFISVQGGHFDLHSSIENVEIRPHKENPMEIQIHYISNQNKDFLTKDRLVRKYFEKEAKTISVHLIGQHKGREWQDGYVLKKLGRGGKYLDHWFTLKKVGLWGRIGSELKLIHGCQKEEDEDGWKEWDDFKGTWNEYKMNY